MTTEDALLAAVLAAPDDDVVRKAFADYLRENGQEERADFIEVQLADVDRGRQAKLLDEYAYLWFPPPLVTCLSNTGTLFKTATPGMIAAHITRGFISEIRCTLADWCGGRNRTCTRCNYAAEHPWEDRCPSCNSHRLLQYPQGIGPQIVRRHPVERVVLNGAVDDGGVAVVRWHRVTRDSVGPLWPLLDTIRRGYMNYDYVEFASRDQADAKISAAAIAWAKSQPHPARIYASPVSVDVTA